MVFFDSWPRSLAFLLLAEVGWWTPDFLVAHDISRSHKTAGTTPGQWGRRTKDPQSLAIAAGSFEWFAGEWQGLARCLYLGHPWTWLSCGCDKSLVLNFGSYELIWINMILGNYGGFGWSRAVELIWTYPLDLWGIMMNYGLNWFNMMTFSTVGRWRVGLILIHCQY